MATEIEKYKAHLTMTPEEYQEYLKENRRIAASKRNEANKKCRNKNKEHYNQKQRERRKKIGRPKKYATKEERLEANRIMDKERYARNHKPTYNHDLSTTQGKIDAFHELLGV